MAPVFDGRLDWPLHATTDAAHTVVVWQEPPHEAPRCLGRFASSPSATRWWEMATGTAFHPVWHDEPHPMATIGPRVKPSVWCGGLSPQAFIAWTEEAAGPTVWAHDRQTRWPTPQALEQALWEAGQPWRWWTPTALFDPGTPDRADPGWGHPDPVWYLGQGAHGGVVLWQWVHDQAAYKVRWIEQAQHPDHAPYEWRQIADAQQWLTTHDPGRPLAGYAPHAVRVALVTTGLTRVPHVAAY